MELPSDYHDRQLTAAFLLNIKIPEIADTFLIFYLTLFLFRLLVTVIVRNSLSLKLVCYHYNNKKFRTFERKLNGRFHRIFTVAFDRSLG